MLRKPTRRSGHAQVTLGSRFSHSRVTLESRSSLKTRRSGHASVTLQSRSSLKTLERHFPAEMRLAVGAVYCASSSLMLLVNKLLVHNIRAPAFFTLVQFAATSAAVLTAKHKNLIELDPFSWTKVKFFALYVLAFSAGTYANMHVLMESNVETVIVFRACTPLAVCLFDYLFHRRDLPSARSLLAMTLIVMGSINYVTHDKSFQVRGWRAYSWVFIWFVLIVFQFTYGKYLVTCIGLRSTWSPVLYTNTLALLPSLSICVLSSDFGVVYAADWTFSVVSLMILSCVLGMAISWSGFKCQSMLAATTYTVIGVLNKLVTVLLNSLAWEKHASPAGIASLVLCLVGGALYQQAPLRKLHEYERVVTMVEGPPSLKPISAGPDCNL